MSSDVIAYTAPLGSVGILWRGRVCIIGGEAIGTALGDVYIMLATGCGALEPITPPAKPSTPV